MKKTKTFTIDVGIFNSIVQVYCGQDYEEQFKHFKDIGYKIDDEDLVYDGCKGVFIPIEHETGETIKILWLKKFDGSIYDIGVVSHECVHAAQYILDDCGIDVDWNGTEQVAYLQEWLFKEILKGLEFKDRKVV